MKKLSILFALFLLVGCATTQVKHDVRGPLDQPTLASIQAQVDSLWVQGNAYIQANPDKLARWNRDRDSRNHSAKRADLMRQIEPYCCRFSDPFPARHFLKISDVLSEYSLYL